MELDTESREKIVLLFRLMGFINEHCLYSREMSTMKPAETNIFKSEIMNKRRETPIIISRKDIDYMKYNPDYRLAKEALKRLTAGQVSLDEWGSTVSFASNVFTLSDTEWICVGLIFFMLTCPVPMWR